MSDDSKVQIEIIAAVYPNLFDAHTNLCVPQLDPPETTTCGDQVCDPTETCADCATDCGVCCDAADGHAQ